MITSSYIIRYKSVMSGASLKEWVFVSSIELWIWFVWRETWFDICIYMWEL